VLNDSKRDFRISWDIIPWSLYNGNCISHINDSFVLMWNAGMYQMKCQYGIAGVVYDKGVIVKVTFLDRCDELGGPSITNAIEEVIEKGIKTYGAECQFAYVDSEGIVTEVAHDGTQFLGFLD
jgi:hypothetical protein